MALRDSLTKMTKNGRVETHESIIESLAAKYQHTIKVVRSNAPIDRYTCVMYALDVANDDEYVEVTMAAPREDIFASPRFLDWLVQAGRLRRLRDPSPRALVIYRKRGQTKHIGVMLDNSRVRSKWGLGLLYEHGELEVPDSYGSTRHYYGRLSRDEAMVHYKRYVEEST
jgi:hypothetical protein